MPVSSEVFGDPCPNTRKYVEVHFACMPKIRTTTTKRPLPPWFLQVIKKDRLKKLHHKYLIMGSYKL